MSDILSLIREDLRDFAGYSSAAKEASGMAPAFKLDANESPWPPFGSVAALCPVQSYAENQPLALRQRLAAVWGIDQDEILLTTGSDQGIDALIRLFCRAGQDSILVCPPTFSMYEVYATLQGARTLSVPLDQSGKLDLTGIKKTADKTTKLVFIPAPNAPTGRLMDRGDILALCKALEGQSIVVVDEAYAEFSDCPDGFLLDLNTITNLVILRTLSKAYALAGERVGCVIAPKKLIVTLRAIVPPYPLAQSAIRAALDVLSPCGLAQSEQYRTTIKLERERMRTLLSSAEGVRDIYPSQGNFLLLLTNDATAFLRRLARFDIRARNMDAQIKGAVRLTISSPEGNNLVLKALGVEVAEEPRNNRIATIQRQTKETALDVLVNLDATSPVSISTGIGFFDHMLEQIAAHGGFALCLQAKGDLDVDRHHTIEDCALALGEAIKSALGDKKGIARFGFTAPLDEALAQVTLDLSGRPLFTSRAQWPDTYSDGMAPDLVEHFFRSFATTLGATIQLDVKGQNNHHMIEACFKALGRALRQACARDGNALPSTKGVL